MKAQISDFIAYLESKVGFPYLWGGQGESLSYIIRKYARTKSQSDSATSKMIKFMKIEDVEFYDCSGLGVKFLMDYGVLKSDTTADGLYRKCDKISKSDVLPGDFVFFVESGKATHIGYVVKDRYVIHALDQSVGVIKEKLSKRNWVYARPNFAFDFDTKKYYPQYKGNTGSIVEIMRSYGEDSSFKFRKKVAVANNVVDAEEEYEGTAGQNTAMVTLAKVGKLIRP